jgi:hypothetical protein
MRLTKRMCEVLCAADLEAGQINDVPMSTMYGFESRGLISSDWRKAAAPLVQTTQGGSFPVFGRVRLTADGIRAARDIQLLRARQQKPSHNSARPD